LHCQGQSSRLARHLRAAARGPGSSSVEAAPQQRPPHAGRICQMTDDAEHTAKMARIKEARDRMMATKSGEKGLVIVHTGKGKGKSSSAFGMVMRCLGH